MLKDLTALSTVTLHVTEVREFVAETPSDFPTFGERVSGAWTGTWQTVATFGQRLVIGAVSAAPWIAILVIPMLVLYRLVRWMIRPAQARSG